MQQPKRLILLFATCCALILMLSACNQSPGQSSHSENSVPPQSSHSENSASPEYDTMFGMPYSEIFRLIREGKYGKAEEIIEQEIIGDSIKENEAKDQVKKYYESLVEQFNNETLSYDDFLFVHENLCKTKLSDYADTESLGCALDLKYSKDRYQRGSDYYSSGDYTEAIKQLSGVLVSDKNYEAAVDKISDIATAWGNSESLAQLKTAVKACDKLQYKRTNADAYSDPSLVNWDNIITEDDCIEIKLRFAQRLEEQKQYRYAIQQYAQLMVDYDYCTDIKTGDITPASEGYFRLMRMLNSKCYTDDGYYYIGKLDSEGHLARSSDAYWTITEDINSLKKYLQIADWYCGDDGHIGITILKPRAGDNLSNVNPLWAITIRNTYADSDSLAVADRIEKTPGITKIVTAPGHGVAALLYDGTVRYYHKDEYRYSDVESWDRIIDLWCIKTDNDEYGFMGLTDDGQIVATSEIVNGYYSTLTEILTWENVTSISFGFELYKLSTGATTRGDSLYALCDDGTVRYVKNYDYDKRATTGEFPDADAIAIAGNYYLDSEGFLHTFLDSLQSEVNRYTGIRFSDIIGPHACGTEHYITDKGGYGYYTVIAYYAYGSIELPSIGRS